MEELTQYNETIEENPLLSFEDEKYLATCIHGGRRNKQKSREKLFNSNLRLVISHATKKHRYNSNVPVADMISNGYVGLMIAVDRFDPSKFEVRFSTYAHRWISLYVNKAILDSNSHIKIPANVLLQRKKYNDKSIEEGSNDEEIMRELNISTNQMRDIRASNTSVISLQSEVNYGNFSTTSPSTIEDLIEEKDDKGVVREVCESEEISMIKIYLDSMDDLKKDIIKSRHLNNEKETLGSIGKRYNLSKERIRQLEKNALDELKSLIKKKTRFSR